MFFGRKSSGPVNGYNFTDEVRTALSQSREEASRLRHEYVGTEHLLLGLLADGSGTAAALLEELRVQPADIRQRVLEIVKKGTGPGNTDLPYTSRSKKVLELAMTAARDLNDNYVGQEHLLLGLINEGRGVAAQILIDSGVTAEKTIAAIGRFRDEREGGLEASFQFQIDDTSGSQSIYEQLIAQTKEAVATGKLQPGSRLPTVRQLADELDIAPGTVARAYSELERLGVVITEGKRGTRVADRERPAISDQERPATLVGLLRPVAVAAFHLGATAPELRGALETAMHDIFNER